MTHYYTRTGDEGYTGLLGDERAPKYDPRLEAVGAVDEATAALGLGRATCLIPHTAALLLAIQRDLYGLMAELAASAENAARFRVINAEKVTWLETQTDAIGAQVTLPREFILPGDCPASAALALGRTTVRRAERRVAQLLHTGIIENPELLRYLNRLSSLCFVLELLENRAAGKETFTRAKGEASI
jgi:cob(I)alamin adenosyltransferase